MTRSRAGILAALGLVLYAFTLRSAVASLSPLFDRIAADFPLSPGVIGLIGTAPPVCYAVFGIVTPAIERRMGLARLVPLTAAIAAVGLIGRALAPDALTLLAGTIVVFAAIGVANVLLPAIVKRYFPTRIGVMTTVFTTTMAASTLIPPLVAVPVADAAGWRVSVGMWALVAIAAVLPWLGLRTRRAQSAVGAPASDAPASVSASVVSRMWRLPLTWALVGGFVVTSATAYTAFAWLPLILTESAGLTEAGAGAMLSLFAAMGLPWSLAIPWIIGRWRHGVGALFATATLCGLGGVAGLLFAPATATWLWVVLLASATLLFPLSLVLIGMRSRTHEGAVALSGVVQSVGYAIAALFPFGVGILHTLTNGWTIPLWALGVLMLVGVPAGIVASRRTTVEDEWERRRGAW